MWKQEKSVFTEVLFMSLTSGSVGTRLTVIEQRLQDIVVICGSG